MANENKPLNEAKPNEPITAQRWNDMQMALRKEHIDHTHNGKWKDGQYGGDPIAADGLADGAVVTARIADAAVTPAKLDPGGDFRARSLALAGFDKNVKGSTLSVTGISALSGMLRVNPGDKDSLTVTDSYVEVGGGANPLRFTSVWSSFPDSKPNAAEITNDTNSYKALMIVGNRSAGGVRKIAMWDRVDVLGRLVVGPGLDAGITVAGYVEATGVKATDVQTTTLGAAGLTTLAQLKVNGTTNSGPVNITGALTVSEALYAAGGVRVGVTPLQAGNRVQIQDGNLHLDGNTVFLRADIKDKYDLLRWNAATDTVDLAGYQGANLGLTKVGQTPGVVTPLLSARENYVDVGLNANPLRLSSNWTNFPATSTASSEISNDTNSYKTLMIIGNRSNDGSTRRVSVWDRLEVNGSLAVTGKVTASAYNIQFFQQLIAVTNNGNAPRDTPINYAGVGFVQIFAAYVVFQGFSCYNNGGNWMFTNYGFVRDTSAIPQHAYALVLNYNTSAATVRTFCQESDPGNMGDNTVLATLVVIGRTN